MNFDLQIEQSTSVSFPCLKLFIWGGGGKKGKYNLNNNSDKPKRRVKFILDDYRRLFYNSPHKMFTIVSQIVRRNTKGVRRRRDFRTNITVNDETSLVLRRTI